MSTQLIDSIIDEAAITKQLTTLNSQLNSTSTNLAGCAVQAKVFCDQFANAKGVQDIVTLMDKYNTTITTSQKLQNDLATIEKTRAETVLQLQKAQESNAKTEALMAQAALNTQKAQDAASKSEQTRTNTSNAQAAASLKSAQAELALATAEDALINALKQAGISVDKLNVSKSQATSVNKLVTSINSSEKGSHEQLAAQYDLNYKAYNKLSSSQRDTTAGKAMADSIGNQSKVLKEMEGGLGNFTRQVGDYKNQILGTLGANQGFIGNLANMAMGAEKTGESFTAAGVGGVKAFGKAMWELMENPIIATIAAIAVVILLVKAAVDSNGEATEKLGQIMAPFKELLSFILNLFSQLVVVILDATLATMSFLNSIMALIPGLDAIAAKNAKAISLEQQKQALEERGRQQTVKNAQDKLQFDDLMMKSRQKDVYSIQQRLEFLQKADAIELQNSQEKTKNATDAYNLLLAQMENEGKTYEQLTIDKRKALKDAEAAMYDTEAEYAEKTRRLHTQESTLVLQDQAEYISNIKTKKDADLEAWKAQQDVSAMTSSQKIAFEHSYSTQSIQIQKDTNALKIADLQKNSDAALKITMDELKKKHDADVQAAKDNKSWDVSTTQSKIDKYNNVLQNQTDKAIEDQKKSLDKSVQVVNEGNAVLDSQQKESDQKKIESDSALHISILQKQQDANLARLKADANYNTMTFEQQQAFDLAYFNMQQANQLKIISLTKEDGAIKTAERKKLAAEADIFAQEQAQKRIQNAEKMLTENASYQEAGIKASENYGDKSIGYQQSLATRIFEIRAKMETDIAKMKYDKDKDASALQISLNNISAQRAQLLESQKEALTASGKAKQLAYDSDFVNQQKTIIDQRYLHGIISETEYQKELKKINEEGATQILNDEIKADRLALLDVNKSADQKLLIQQDLNKKLEQADAKHVLTKEQKDKALAAKEIELVKATAAAIQTIGDDQFQAQCDQIEALKTKNSDAATAETAVITAKYNSGILTQKEADAQSAAIDAQKAARDTQLTDQENKVKTKNAIFDKEMSAFNIVISTGAAIMGALAEQNVPLAIADAAMGAVELAAVLAKPLPAYAFGTEDHPGGSAIVGDGFKHELAVTPQGQFIKTPNVPTIMNFPEHTKVLPVYDLAIQSLAFNASISSMNTSTPTTQINVYNDALMRKTMGSLVSQTERQIGELGRLKDIGKSMENVVATNLKIADAIKRNKKNDWVS